MWKDLVINQGGISKEYQIRQKETLKIQVEREAEKWREGGKGQKYE